MRDVQLRREYAAFHAELQSLRLMIRKLLIELEANPDKASPTLPTYIKLIWGPFLQRYTEFLLRAEGIDALKWQPSIPGRSEEHTSELQSLMRISYAVFCLKKTKEEQQIKN